MTAGHRPLPARHARLFGTAMLVAVIGAAVLVAVLVIAVQARNDLTEYDRRRDADLFATMLRTGQASPWPERGVLGRELTFVFVDSSGRRLASVRDDELATTDLAAPRWRRLAGEVQAGRVRVDLEYTLLPTRVGYALLGMAIASVVVALTWIARRAGRAWVGALAELEHRMRTLTATPQATLQATPAYAEVRRLDETMHALLTRLDEERRRRHEYIAEVVHELRSPITALRTRADGALMFPDRIDPVAALQAVVAEAGRLEQVVGQLGAVAGIEPRNPDEAVDVVALVQQVVHRTRDPRVQVVGSEDARVIGSLVLLDTAVTNLVSNARRFGRDRVEVSVIGQNGQVLIRVDDDGPGIPVSDVERVFHRRVTAGATGAGDAAGLGLGLGLPIVRAVAELHGGSIGAASSPLGGARLELALPESVDR